MSCRESDAAPREMEEQLELVETQPDSHHRAECDTQQFPYTRKVQVDSRANAPPEPRKAPRVSTSDGGRHGATHNKDDGG